MRTLTLMVPIMLVTLVGCHEPGAGRAVGAVVDGPVSLAPERDIAAGDVSGVSAVDAADIDGDGLPDVGVFEGGTHAGGRVTFAWFESPDVPGDDAWARHDFNQPSPMRSFIGAARFADLDADGDPDLVVSMDNHSGGTRSAYLYVLENPRPAGAATDDWPVHEVATDLPVHHINDMELADMDADGAVDIVVRALDPNQLRLYFQDGLGDWEEKVIDSSPFGATGEGFAVGDLDGAGPLDISICGHWLEAPSDPRGGTYAAHTIDAEYMTINANVKEAIGDLDGDGDQDVIISPAEGYRSGGNHVLAWYANPGDPTSASSWERTVLETDFNGGHTVRLADIDGDADLDVVSGVAWSSWGQEKHVALYFNLGDGSFGEPQTVVTGKGLYTAAVVDVGGDGDLDIVGQDGYAASHRPYLYESLEGPGPGPGPGEDGGVIPSGDGGVVDGDGGTAPGGDAGGPSGDGGPDAEADSGCGCSAGTRRPVPGTLAVIAAVVATFARRRRRRR